MNAAQNNLKRPRFNFWKYSKLALWNTMANFNSFQMFFGICGSISEILFSGRSILCIVLVILKPQSGYWNLFWHKNSETIE